MKTFRHLQLAMIAGLLFVSHQTVRADGRPGSVEWSDGRKLVGAISLTPGKDLRLFTATGQVSIQLAEVKEMRFTTEKEEMREGFYFPNAGQATQAKTGDVYPSRSLKTQITLSNGTNMEGHLFTTTLYVETDDATEKVVLMAKQTGADGQKLSDLAYPTLIHFDSDSSSAGSLQIDLTDAGLSGAHPPIAFAEPNLTLLPLQQINGKQIWTLPQSGAEKFLFSVEATDAIHVAWPPDTNENSESSSTVSGSIFPPEEADPLIQNAVQASLKEMQDFYDTRTLLGCFADADDVYSLVIMKRLGPTDSFKAGKIPWSLVMLRWKYDPDAKKTTLLNRVSLAMGRAEDNSPIPKVLIEPELLRDISALPASASEGSHP